MLSTMNWLLDNSKTLSKFVEKVFISFLCLFHYILYLTMCDCFISKSINENKKQNDKRINDNYLLVSFLFGLSNNSKSSLVNSYTCLSSILWIGFPDSFPNVSTYNY